ncbi:DEAD-box ATP-dependent RNA helicase [Thoreauomyces humboldtii]|nr:DEAD-box ATP-dependent RNA helicase [Thoreauomyces humboldtii]
MSTWDEPAVTDAWDANPASAPSKNGDHSDTVPIGTTGGDDSWGQDTHVNGDAPAAPAAETRTHKFTGFDKEVIVAPAGEHHWLASGKTWEEGLRDTDLEQQLYKADRVPTGLHFEEIQKVRVGIRGGKPPQILQSFQELNTDPEKLDALFNNLTANMQYKTPTPIQSAAIPILLGGRDVMATAQTGSGKTAAYFIPIMIKLLKRGKEARGRQDFFNRMAEPQALVIVPTRELAAQIYQEARKFAYMTWVRPCAIYGGAETKALLNELDKGCDILIATPGKLMDFLGKGKVSLRRIKDLVFDEADRLFELGFDQDILRICQGFDLPQDESKRVALFSATFPKEIRGFASQFVGDCLLLTAGRVGVVPKDITQTIIQVEENQKREKLLDILFEAEAGLTLIFVNHVRTVDTLDDSLFNMGFPITSIHSHRTQEERESSISAFRSNKMPLMVSTDVAARGLDIPNIVHVINYDMPTDIADYIHRIGRTARVGNIGASTSFMKEEEIETLGPQLVQVLKETDQAIPEFLQQFADDDAEDDEGGAELMEEDLDRELPEGYGPLGAGGSSGDAGGGGNEWGESGGDDNAGGDEANAGGDGDDNVPADNEGGGGW